VPGLEVSAVRTRRERRAFVGLPYRLHRHDPLWTPLLRRDVRALLSRARNPFFAHAEAEYFLARRGRRVVGRIAAIENRRHNEFHGDRVGFFGFFEAEDDAEAASALLAASGRWLRGRGLEVMRGPVSFSTNDEAGLLVDGFDTPSVLRMPYNPRYYVSLLEQAGFTKAKDLLAYQRTFAARPERPVPSAAMERRYGLRTRPLDMSRFPEEVARVKRLYNAAWERNWGFVPMTDAEIDHLAAQLRPVVVPELVAFAERGAETVGFAVALPDLSVALRANRSGRLLPGLLKILWKARRIRRLRLLLLGTAPEWRRRGVDALLYQRLWEGSYARGFRWAEAGWILEDNHPVRNSLQRLGFDLYKTYRIYDRVP
jgi:GNAT superfamily N-acetyltransferase